ncbi:MAG: glycosyltransferase [Nocardioides sp.]
MADGSKTVHLLMYRADGPGGVAKTAINLANELVKERPVRIISLYRVRPEPAFRIDPRVDVTWLLVREPGLPDGSRPFRKHAREDWEVALDALPTTLAPEGAEEPLDMSAYTDHVLAEAIGAITAGVIVSTRPTLHVAAVRHARDGVVVIGQDHGNFLRRSANPAVMQAMAEAVPRLDSYVVLTEDDERDYRSWAPEGTRVDRIPNGHTTPPLDTTSALDSKLAVGAGRFEPSKGFDRLVEAWAALAPDAPGWELHLYGAGPEVAPVRDAIRKHGLDGSVHLKGFSDRLDQVLAESSVFVMGSRTEGFPMVLVEAMGKGLPLVAFDCPRGPADLIEDGVNGRLVPNDDIDGFAAALHDVISDPDRRRKMGAASLARADEFQMSRIAARWVSLFDTLTEQVKSRHAGPRVATEPVPSRSDRRTARAKVVVVAGSGRSGTSTIAGVLKMIGLAVPQPEVAGDQTNPRGFFEPKWVVDFQSRLLRQSTARLTDARPAAFETTHQIGARDDTRRVVGAWLRGHVNAGDEMVVKDPRSSWFLPMWRRAAADANAEIAILTMLRHPAEVVGSKDHYYKAAKAGDTPRHAQTRGTAGWINVALHTEYSTRDAHRTFVRYDDLLDDWRAVVSQVTRDLGLVAGHAVGDDAAAEVDAFVDPGLRRIRTEWHEVDCPAAVRDLAQEVWEQLCVLSESGGFDPEAERRLDDCRRRYVELYADAEALAQSSIDAATAVVRRTAKEEAREVPRRQRAQAAPTTPPTPPAPPPSVPRRAAWVGRRLASAAAHRIRGS